MVYFAFFLLLLIGIIRFDITLVASENKSLPRTCKGRNNPAFGYKHASQIGVKQKILYYFVFICLFLLSGLSYRVGSDIGRYMYDFELVSWSDIDLSQFVLSARMPLWTALMSFCKSLVNSFIFFKICTSFIVCFVIFSFFRKRTKYIFTALFFYFIMMSFDMNFNILRQSLAICAFLVSSDFLCRKKYVPCVLAIIAAIMFHNSAIFLLPVPLINAIDFRKRFITYYVILVVLCFIVLNLPHDNILFNIFLNAEDEALSSLSASYLDGDYGNAIYSYVSVIVHLCVFFFVSFYYFRSGATNFEIGMVFLYIFCFIVSSSIPIIGRIKFYFWPFYIIALCNAIYYFCSNIKIHRRYNKQVILLFLILVFSYSPIRYFFLINPRTNLPNYVQYYPYYSVFDPKKSPDREILINI